VLTVLFEASFFTLYSYPLFMGLAWGVGFYLTRFLFEKHQIDTSPLIPLFIGIFVTSWIGAKVFFLIVSSEHKSYQHLYANSFWLGGGFVFYGGLLFGLAYYFIYSLWLKKFPFKESKLLIPGLVFGHAIGRVGCFLTGCCFGTQCEYPWAVHMHGAWIHPVQLYEAFGLLVIGYLTLKWSNENKDNTYIVTKYLLLYAMLRFIVEYFRGDKIRGIFWLNLSTSQMISLAIFIATLVIIIIRKRNSPK
jgi:phosphatidylglycerol:prolipoprotein diacylglycerol transferase